MVLLGVDFLLSSILSINYSSCKKGGTTLALETQKQQRQTEVWPGHC